MKLFISYSRKDAPFVDSLVQQLERLNHTVWVDRSNISGGADWMNSIVQAIAGCDCFIVILSPASLASDNVKKEVLLANQKNKRIIPARYQACTLAGSFEYLLADLQFVDFDAQNPGAFITQLSQALQGTAVAPPPTNYTNPPPPATPPGGTYTGQLNLFGAWQVFTWNYGQWVAVGDFTFSPAGFVGRMNMAEGLVQSQGAWRLTGNQVFLQGQMAYATMPYNLLPYYGVFTITQVQGNSFTGFDGNGVTMLLQRMG